MTTAVASDATVRPGAEAASTRSLSRRQFWGAPVLGLFLLGVGSASAQSLPTFAIPATSPSDRPNSEQAFASVEIHERPAPAPVVFEVSPRGSDAGDGSAARPFASLERARAAVRGVNAAHAVTVRLADGVYRLDAPLRFSEADGGQNGFVVRWEAAKGARPVISGGVPVVGWRRADARRDIWVADIPRGADPRQLWVNDRMARRAEVEAPRTAFAFHDWGIQILDPAWRFLAELPDQTRLEVENTGFFTDRRARVESIRGDRILLAQPGWRNNLIGYDTFARPVSGDRARFFIANALAFVREEGDWWVDPARGRLYYKPRGGEPMAASQVVMPTLQALVSIAGAPGRPVHDLQFSGIGFQHTSWLGPSGPQGYASQQSGAYLADDVPNYPSEPIRDCSWGCWAFEAMRNHWRQQPAAVQVAAAARILFEDVEFAHLGQVALGVGNDASANLSGAGLEARSVEVVRSRFADLAGGAIMVGGVGPDAHHPSRPELAVRDIVIRDNTITKVSQVYREQAAILVTYATAPLILRNDVSETPYDGIDVGWGWGVNDPGGNTAYMSLNRGYYDQPANRVYDTPTILRDTVILGNRVHGVKRWFPDGGAIYHLSADPGALIAENHVYDVPGGIGVYLDEGSRYVTVRDNVFDGLGLWVNLNALDGAHPRRTAMDNVARGNWHNAGKANGSWSDYAANRLADNIAVDGQAWPEGARKVIDRAGPARSAAPDRTSKIKP
ncbi:pectate lyase [Caulobacter sp. Root1455]|uniref:right-handed parallel beta-helix repeat-containing protein n=1 Tax=Caulobacter sp. Root1455 TaxID=1736465 RepID=UPI0006F1DF7E|nr:right-handed parallel beta-helix repeat-containing protein [Caulobacter sp. Root1455]KQZ04772.1 pectate lyase [Caulobacter sp. Root1455]